ncbi:MAG: SUMF1/EgtB/PvdO family nonheme iron enzyme, partial [Verrucomicrobia bacterium]|nr:SUMF1/EgtB/PvdO family nonheme iron enzyme [Verrucomicrobiota bacterium]
MHGNVYEWCLDQKNKYPETPVVDPVETGTDDDYRAIRGGSYSYYDDGAKNCRSAARNVRLISATSNSIGFRVALVMSTRNMTIPLSGDVSLDMIWVEPGTFMMGSPKDEHYRDSEERLHEVILTHGYWLSQYEITQPQYEAIMGTNPSHYKGADLPVHYVSWYDAKAFCEKLTEIEKAAGRLPEEYEYTLPSEAQWEYACRAGTTTALNSGKNLSGGLSSPEMDEVGWYKYNVDKSRVQSVGQKLPNAWGFYDMHGNVAEWCLDKYESYPYDTSKPVTDPLALISNRDPVIRGGSYEDTAGDCRSACRDKENGDHGNSKTGFRVALTFSKNMTIPLSGDVDLDMIWVEPGNFTMGSYESEDGRDEDENEHRVTLTEGYWLGKYEVTQAQYEAVMGSNPSQFTGADLPVEMVSWDDATNFCAKLTAIELAAGRLPEGYKYTLPTEAQWEYACRAGSWATLYNGSSMIQNLNKLAWFKDTSSGTTHPVGQKQPNDLGMYDLYGNVFEWCSDWYGDYPESAVRDPMGAITGWARVTRGGSWGSPGERCRSASRGYAGPDYQFNNLGFRVALTSTRDFTIPLSEDVSMDMLWINQGAFIMGSPEDELGRSSDEIQHEVLLSGYWLGKYEVTQAQFEAVMGWNASYCQGADLPVENVRWEDAMNFCARLTAAERAAGRLPSGYKYTLPTEAQWEYACRAETTTAFNNGKNIPSVSQETSEPCPNLDEVGWYTFNAGKTSHPVGQKLPNGWGLYDMHGNVLEWCSDWYGAYSDSEVLDPRGPSMGTEHVTRGGGWDHTAWTCRSAFRDKNELNYSYVSVGFRVALAKSSDFELRTSKEDASTAVHMIAVTPGSFVMGSPKNELGRYGDETSHPVTLTQNYWLSHCEVTQGLYEAVMGTNPSYNVSKWFPVENV